MQPEGLGTGLTESLGSEEEIQTRSLGPHWLAGPSGATRT
jgi:hypothetical protein